ncbi:unnamed protein product [Symbiodinium pilosum]|uniref:Uncharacterized protein n=1 Tax=Symbiodinium pilosum TaxID=2952 RepID=A0A812LNE1_SYMPI|nr:unnamed protein product [Symbiodinium pilosum]
MRKMYKMVQQLEIESATSLGQMGPAAAERLPQLIEALVDKDEDVRSFAAEALGRIGPSAAAAGLPQLLQALEDQVEFVRSSAAESLGRMGPAAVEIVPQLLKAREDQDDNLRGGAAEALGSIGPVANEAVPQLLKVLEDKDQPLRGHTAEAVAKINPASLPWESLIAALARVDAMEPAHGILLQLAPSHHQCSEDSMDPLVATAVQQAIRYTKRKDVFRLAVKALPAALRTSELSTFQRRSLVQRALQKVPYTAVECKLHEMMEAQPTSSLRDPSEQDMSLPDSDEASFIFTLSSSGKPVRDEALLAQLAGHLPQKSFGVKADSFGCSSGCEASLRQYGLQTDQNKAADASSQESQLSCQSEAPEVPRELLSP